MSRIEVRNRFRIALIRPGAWGITDSSGLLVVEGSWRAAWDELDAFLRKVADR